MKDASVYVSLDIRIDEIQVRVSRVLESQLWRDRPLAVLEYEVRAMLMQLLAPAVAAYDQRVSDRQAV